MRIVLDECVPKRLRRSLAGHQVFTIGERGWNGKRNGLLLALLVADAVDVMITVDRGIRFQQNLSLNPVALIVVLSPTNRLSDLLPFVPQIQAALVSIQSGQYVEIKR
jgi:hypothetical protein